MLLRANSAPIPNKLTLDRLASMTELPLPEWRWHEDVPHPEDPLLDDSKWQVTKLDATWSTRTRVFRRWVEIPEKISGHTIQGASVKLDVAVNSDRAENIAVFSGGSMIFRAATTTRCSSSCWRAARNPARNL